MMDVENQPSSDLYFLLTTEKAKNDPELREKVEAELLRRKEVVEQARVGTRIEGSRTQFAFGVFIAFCLIPLGFLIFGQFIDYDFGVINKIYKTKQDQVIATGFKFNFLSIWYVSIPVYLYYAYKRISDTYLNKYLLIVLCLPVLNLFLLFWPSRKYE